MPYKFEYKHIKIPPEKDRRIKLTKNDRAEIKSLHKNGMSIRKITLNFNVNRRLIQFILFPERLKHNKELRQLRGGSKQYYNKKYNTQKMKEHRQYKYKVLNNMEV